MITIHRYPFPVCERVSIDMPRGAKILHIDRDSRNADDLAIWAWVDAEAMIETRQFQIVGTGQPVPHYLQPGDHIGTVQIAYYVWHVFEVIRA